MPTPTVGPVGLVHQMSPPPEFVQQPPCAVSVIGGSMKHFLLLASSLKSSCFLPLCFCQQERSGCCFLVHQLVALSYSKISCNYSFCRNSSTVMLATKQRHQEIHQQDPIFQAKIETLAGICPYVSDKILQTSSKNHPIFIFQTSPQKKTSQLRNLNAEP